MNAKAFARIVIDISHGTPQERGRAIFELLMWIRAQGGDL